MLRDPRKKMCQCQSMTVTLQLRRAGCPKANFIAETEHLARQSKNEKDKGSKSQKIERGILKTGAGTTPYIEFFTGWACQVAYRIFLKKKRP